MRLVAAIVVVGRQKLMMYGRFSLASWWLAAVTAPLELEREASSVPLEVEREAPSTPLNVECEASLDRGGSARSGGGVDEKSGGWYMVRSRRLLC